MYTNATTILLLSARKQARTTLSPPINNNSLHDNTELTEPNTPGIKHIKEHQQQQTDGEQNQQQNAGHPH